MSRKTKSPTAAPGNGHGAQAGIPSLGLIDAALWLTLLGICIAAFFPGARLWGINHLAFYPLELRSVIIAMLLMCALPPLRNRMVDGAMHIVRGFRRGGRAMDVVVVVTVVLAVGLFITLRAETQLWGDGRTIARTFEAGLSGSGNVTMASVRDIMSREVLSPGSVLVYYGAARLGSALWQLDPAASIAYLNCILGGLYVLMLVLLWRRSSLPPHLAAWLLILGLASAPIMLYFGYVEFYTPMMFLGALYVVAAFRYLHRRGRWWHLLLLLAAAVYAHVQAVLLAPSLLYLFIHRHLSRSAGANDRTVVLALAGASVVVAVGAGLFTPLARFYLPLLATQSTYGVLSPAHLLDIGNELLLLLPSVLALSVMAARGTRMRQRPAPPASERNAGAKPSAWFTRREEWHLAILLLLPSLLYLLLFRPEIGMARDWDLFTIVGLGLYPLALLVVNRYHAHGGFAQKVFQHSFPILVATVMLTAMWIGTHASWPRSADRFERILDYDQTHAAYAYENLALLYEEKGQLDRAIEFSESALRVAGSGRLALRLSKYYQKAGRLDLATHVMRTAVAREPDYHDGRVWLIVLLEQAAGYAEILSLARDGTQLYPTENVYWFYLGESSMALRDTATAVSAYHRALELNPPSAARRRIEQQLHASEASP